MKSQENDTFGARLRKERKRLGMTQQELGLVGGVSKTTQLLYEGGTHPEAVNYLARIAAAGADVMFLLTDTTQAQRAAQAVDWELLAKVVEALVEVQRETGKTIRADKLGQVIRQIYLRQIGEQRSDPAADAVEIVNLLAA